MCDSAVYRRDFEVYELINDYFRFRLGEYKNNLDYFIDNTMLLWWSSHLENSVISLILDSIY